MILWKSRRSILESHLIPFNPIQSFCSENHKIAFPFIFTIAKLEVLAIFNLKGTSLPTWRFSRLPTWRFSLQHLIHFVCQWKVRLYDASDFGQFYDVTQLPTKRIWGFWKEWGVFMFCAINMIKIYQYRWILTKRNKISDLCQKSYFFSSILILQYCNVQPLMTIRFPTAFVARSWNETLGSCQGEEDAPNCSLLSFQPYITILKPYITTLPTLHYSPSSISELLPICLKFHYFLEIYRYSNSLSNLNTNSFLNFRFANNQTSWSLRITDVQQGLGYPGHAECNPLIPHAKWWGNFLAALLGLYHTNLC